MAVAIGETTFVASSRPPRPTSRTATSTRARRNSSNAAAVVTSKNVGWTASAPSARSCSMVSRISSTTAASRSRATGCPSMVNRSVRSTRCGEVYRAERWPAALSAASTIATTEPLPFVPATCTDWNARSGWPSRATIVEMLSRPNLIPNFSRPNR